MSSSSTIAFGSTLSYSADNAAWTAVGQTVDLNSPESEVAKIKITNNDSPNNSQEYVPGLNDPGDMPFDLVYKPSVQAGLYTAKAARTILYWKEIFPDGSGWTFQAFISKISNEGKTENEAIKGKIELALTTAAVYVQDSLS